jgi:hypothetical protein
VKAGVLTPWMVTAVLYVLLGWRLVAWGWKKWKKRGVLARPAATI